MTLEALLVWLVIGGIAGWLAGEIWKGAGFGLVGNIIVGIIGAAVAGLLFPSIGWNMPGLLGSIVHALIGALVVLFGISLVRRAA